ncbi:MAG: hypothetical protein HQL69_24215 [Magnetococcales bacterium]|nr:hypothetical protein [Magnetococcales bacterium]
MAVFHGHILTIANFGNRQHSRRTRLLRMIPGWVGFVMVVCCDGYVIGWECEFRAHLHTAGGGTVAASA